MAVLESHRGQPLRGRATVPGDKSISHRALIIAALAAGASRLLGLSDGEDVARTIGALGALGIPIRAANGEITVSGRGLGGLRPPGRALDLGNSGTGVRLLMGALAAHNITAELRGDASLSARPMGPLIEPLRRMGARITPVGADALPLTFAGTAEPIPIHYEPSIPSAQIKSAILLAGLGAMGTTTVAEPFPTRDHAEILLKQFGARIRTRRLDTGRRVSVEGWRELRATAVSVPGDVSAAAFILAAALLVPGSDVAIENAGLNPTRAGFLKVLKRMGAKIDISRRRVVSGEARGTLRARHAKLRAVRTSAREAPGLIDEFPALFVLAAAAEGVSHFAGLAALRAKESDRLAAMAGVLAQNGIEAAVTADSLTVHGAGGLVPGGGEIDAGLDHRVGMAAAILGLGAGKPVRVAGAETIATSFPGFVKIMRTLGANLAFDRKGRS